MELINKEEVFRVIKLEMGEVDSTRILKRINKLRTVERRPEGEWIKNEYGWYYHCSVCKENNLLHTDEANALSDYCPHCGAPMKGEE